MNCLAFTLTFTLFIQTQFPIQILRNGVLYAAAFPVPCYNWSRLDLSDLCPSQNISLSEDSKTPCLSNDLRKPCPQARVFGVSFGFDDALASNEDIGSNPRNGTSCTHYHLITETVVNEINLKICSPRNATFLQVAFESQSAFNQDCTLSVQQYNLSLDVCDSLEKIDLLRQLPNCIEYPYSSKLKHELITNLSLISLFGEESEYSTHNEKELQVLVKEPQPLPSKSKQTEVRRVERQDVIRKIRNIWSWSWRDHVLEITISLICSALIILIALKVCLAERFMDAYQNARMIPISKEEHNQHRRLSDLISNPYKKHPNPNAQPPSKPILKNGYHKKPHSLSKSLSRLRDQNAAEIRSFESQSSVYYDALEVPESVSHSEPLISSSEAH